MEPRRGRQTPPQAVTLPYSDTRGQQAVELYQTTGRTAQEWQQLLLCDILAENDEGLWVHTRFGYSVPCLNIDKCHFCSIIETAIRQPVLEEHLK